MKKIIFILSAIALFSFSLKKINANKASATVIQEEGVYVFTDCKPDSTYEYLGTIKPVTLNGYHSQVRSAATKLAKKKFPDCDAIILSDDDSKADVVKFK